MDDIVVTDNILLSRAVNGDRSAFSALLERHEGAVAATVIGMLGNTEEAKDVGLEVFVRFYRSMSQFRGEANLRTYLTRIAINLSLNELKRRKRMTGRFEELEPETLHSSDPSPEEMAIGSERNAMVRSAIEQLDPGFREVVVLRLVQGLSVRETAEILEVPIGTVLSRLSRAQKKLRSMIKPLLANYDEHN